MQARPCLALGPHAAQHGTQLRARRLLKRSHHCHHGICSAMSRGCSSLSLLLLSPRQSLDYQGQKHDGGNSAPCKPCAVMQSCESSTLHAAQRPAPTKEQKSGVKDVRHGSHAAEAISSADSCHVAWRCSYDGACEEAACDRLDCQ